MGGRPGGDRRLRRSADPLCGRDRSRRASPAKDLRGEGRRAGRAGTARIAKARFAVYGTSIYPDATFTLRLSYGKIAGWTIHDQTIPSFTYFEGLYDRATGQPPFELTQKWIDVQAKLNPNTVFDISSTIDIIPGNSGSPLIDARGEVIGAVFDGNIYFLGGDFAYDGRLNRGVSVSTAAITEGLEKVYQDPELVKELRAAQ